MKKKVIIKSLIASCLLSIFTTYMVQVILYTHFHVVNGQIVKHIHPFKNPHKHQSASEFYTYAQLVPRLEALEVELILFDPFYTFLVLIKAFAKIVFQAIHLLIPSLRGPPVVSLSL